MVVDTNKESININKLVCEKKETLVLEGDMIVPDSKPDILSTINTSGNICVYKKELMDEKIKIDGNVNIYIMYMPDSAEDNVRGINTSLDFSKIFDVPNCKSDMILNTEIQIKNIDCDVINGRKIGIKVRVEISFKVYSNDEVELINEVLNNENIQTMQSDISVNSLVGYGTTKAYVKDTISIDNSDNLGEILKININMVDRDVKTSYNKVLAKTEAEIKVIYLTEENKISTVTSRIPIVGFVDIPNVSEENVCDTSFEIRNMIIKPNNVEEHSIYIELEVGVSCMVYEEKTLNLLQDLYSPTEELECEQKEISTVSSKENRREACHINETVKLNGLEESQLIDVDCMPSIVKVNKLNSRVIYEGEIALDFSTVDSNSQLNTIQIVIPFEFTAQDIPNAEMLNINTVLEVGTQDFIIKNGGEVTVDVDIIFNISMCQNVNINIIDSIELSENRSEEDYSLVIYIVKPGDTLWNIAKKLNSTVEDIMGANGMEDGDIIQPGDKLYIPKYVKRGVIKQVESPTMMSYA